MGSGDLNNNPSLATEIIPKVINPLSTPIHVNPLQNLPVCVLSSALNCTKAVSNSSAVLRDNKNTHGPPYGHRQYGRDRWLHQYLWLVPVPTDPCTPTPPPRAPPHACCQADISSVSVSHTSSLHISHQHLLRACSGH
jgi:hypothetical protein